MSGPAFFIRGADDFGGKISFIITDIIEYLRSKNAQKEEGFFRLTGSKNGVATLSAALNEGRFTMWDEYDNLNTIGDTLKQYLRELTKIDPLIPFELYDSFIALGKKPDSTPDEYRTLILKLSPARQATLAFLLKFCCEIAEQVDTSKMDCVNLGKVFAPNVIASTNQSPEFQMTMTGVQNTVVTYLIEHFDIIFKGIDYGPSMILTDDEIETLIVPPIPRANIEKIKSVLQVRRESNIPYTPPEFMKAGIQRPTEDPIL